MVKSWKRLDDKMKLPLVMHQFCDFYDFHISAEV